MSDEAPLAECGSCNMCCKLLEVKTIAKPRNEWCTHCDRGRGCRIYEDRPADCRTFECLWLQTRARGLPIEDALRPDRSKAVWMISTDGKRHVFDIDPAFPDAHRKPPLNTHIRKLISLGQTVILVIKDRRILIDQNRGTENLR